MVALVKVFIEKQCQGTWEVSPRMELTAVVEGDVDDTTDGPPWAGRTSGYW